MYIVEYSPSQQAFHVSEESDTITRNLINIKGRVKTDWLFLGSRPTYPQADKLRKTMQQFLEPEKVNQ